MPTVRSLGYISGAPRVSTHPRAAASGPRSHVLGVMRAFEGLGWQVHPFIVGDRVPQAWILGKQSEAPLSRSLLKRAAADLLRMAMNPVSGLSAVRQLSGVDWVYERFASFQALGWWFQRRGIPWILETNGVFFIEAHRDRRSIALSGVAQRIEISAYRKCDVLVCVSDKLAELVVAEAGFEEGKVLVVPNAVDTATFDPARWTPRRTAGFPTIGFAGTIGRWQSLDTLIRAIAELAREKIVFNLAVVGDGGMLDEWRALAHRLCRVSKITFEGRISATDLPAYVAGFDLAYSGHIATEVGEMYHSPLKIYESMAMGVPVVASAGGDACRLIEDGVDGFLFAPGDKEDLKRALRKAYAQREHWREMGGRARSVILQGHDWASRANGMIAGIEPILEAKYGSPYPARRAS